MNAKEDQGRGKKKGMGGMEDDGQRSTVRGRLHVTLEYMTREHVIAKHPLGHADRIASSFIDSGIIGRSFHGLPFEGSF